MTNVELLLYVFILFLTQANSKILSIGNSNAKVVVKVFSSLTCPHCADFHQIIFENLKKLVSLLLKYPNIWILSDDIYEKINFSMEGYTNIVSLEKKTKRKVTHS